MKIVTPEGAEAFDRGRFWHKMNLMKIFGKMLAQFLAPKVPISEE